MGKSFFFELRGTLAGGKIHRPESRKNQDEKNPLPIDFSGQYLL
jgi:hypothetical protein